MTQVACANSFIALVCSLTDAQPAFSRLNFHHLGEVQPNLTAKEITAALDVVAKELQKRKQSVTIVAVGGAINTVLLSKSGAIPFILYSRYAETRASTADVDFFGVDKRLPSGLTDAIKKAVKTVGINEGWLNNHTALFIDNDRINSLFLEAVNDNTIIFKKPGLTVLAAPWRYCLVAKLDKAGKSGAKAYDIDDAAAYLHELVKQTSGPVTKAKLQVWAKEFNVSLAEGPVSRLATTYKAKYGTAGVTD